VSDFKKGDRVQVTSSGSPVYGRVGTVYHVDNGHTVSVHLDGMINSREDRWMLALDSVRKLENKVPTVPPLPDDTMRLPVDSTERKQIPLVGGLLNYFPDALVAVARISKKGNEKHNPGKPLHWSRDKSTDHLECIARHLVDWDKIDPDDGEYHIDHLIWRACAQSQLLKEAHGAKKAPGAR